MRKKIRKGALQSNGSAPLGYIQGKIRESGRKLRLRLPAHSHSMVPGGLLVMSYTTRLQPGTSLMMRLLTLLRRG